MLTADTAHRARNRIAAFLIAGTALVASPAFAEPTDLEALAKNPQEFLGQEVEMAAYCVKGGRTGDVFGYECTTDAGIYVDADEIEPETAIEKLADCGSTQSDACRATVQFVPHSFTTSGVIEPDKNVIVFNTEKAKVTF